MAGITRSCPLYKLHLILKYLWRRRIAWVSLLAVTLCTAMVLVVISVMGGWLRMFRASFHGLSGDVIVSARSIAGFSNYEEMIRRIEALPEVGPGNAVPSIRSFGLINVMNVVRDGVQVIGYPLDKIVNINDFEKSLYRQYIAPREKLLAEAEKPGISRERREELLRQAENIPPPSFNLIPDLDYERFAPVPAATSWPGMIVGSGVVLGKNARGEIERGDYLYEAWARLTVLQVDPEVGKINIADAQAEKAFWIVDDSRTQVYQYDSNTVYVDFHVLQELLDMGPQKWTDTTTGREFVTPARTSEIHIKVKPGVPLVQARQKIEKIVADVREEFAMSSRESTITQTWEESQAKWLGAIENEKSLVTILFAIISVVAIFLIFCIFYMIVVEKTRDIGIIKSVGATSTGVAGIFLGYGLVIGLLGSGLGFALGYAIVTNINWLHTKLGELTGRAIWDPEVYAFDIIPNTMDPNEVTVILIVAVVASVLGALVPAVRAARLHPIEALRWE